MSNPEYLDKTGLDELVSQTKSYVGNKVSKKIDKPVNVLPGKVLQTDSHGDPIWGEAIPQADITQAVDNWLEENIDPGSAVTLDPTLTQQQAAAQAKAVGDAIDSLKENLVVVDDNEPESDDNVIWVSETPENEVVVPTISELNEVAGTVAKDYVDLTFPIKAGTLCRHEYGLYAAKQDIPTQEAWNSGHWSTKTNIADKLDSLSSALDMGAVSKTVSGTHIGITDGVLNSNIISISGPAVMNNGNLLPDSYLSSEYITPKETEGFNFNRNGFAIVDNEHLASILKPGLQYTVSFDFENLEIASEFAENYRYGILLQKSGTPLPGASALNDFMTESRFYVGYEQHFSSVISIPDDGIGDLRLIVYSGSVYGHGLSRISNLIIAGGNSELPWVQSQRIDVLAGETPEISYLPVYFDAGEPVVVEYMSDGISNNAIDKLNTHVETIEADEKRKKYTVNPHIKNICHRGYSKIAPEDTEPAYVYAKIAGYEYVENDLWFTSDGVPVMVHARDLSLVSNGTGNIDEVTYSYFKSLDFGQSSIYGDKYAGLKGSSLEEFVLLCKKLGLKIYLDCKSFSPVPTGYRSGAEKAVEILKKYQMENATTFLLSGSGVQVIRSLLPNARVGYMSNDHSAETIEYLAGLATDGEVFINSEWSTITSADVNSFHEAGISVEAWSADLGISNQRVKEIVDTGVDGITADGINLDAIITESLAEQYGF